MANSEESTIVLVWPNGTYYVVGEDSDEEIEQAINHNDDFTRLRLPPLMTLEDIDQYVNEWVK